MRSRNPVKYWGAYGLSPMEHLVAWRSILGIKEWDHEAVKQHLNMLGSDPRYADIPAHMLEHILNELADIQQDSGVQLDCDPKRLTKSAMAAALLGVDPIVVVGRDVFGEDPPSVRVAPPDEFMVATADSGNEQIDITDVATYKARHMAVIQMMPWERYEQGMAYVFRALPKGTVVPRL